MCLFYLSIDLFDAGELFNRLTPDTPGWDAPLLEKCNSSVNTNFFIIASE